MTTPKIENPFKYGTDPELNVIFDKLIGLKKRVDDEFEKAGRIAGFGSGTKYQKLTEAKVVLPDYRGIRTRNVTSWASTKTPLAKIHDEVQAALIEAKEHVDSVEQMNEPLIAHNNEITKQITQIMTSIGVETAYTTYEYATTRSRTKKSVTHSAGYLGDLRRAQPQSNVAAMRYKISDYERDYQSWVTAEKAAENKARIEQDAVTVEKKILGNPELVATLMQAGVNILAEVQKAQPGAKADVIEYCMATAISNVTRKNKYLQLGYYLQLCYENNHGPVAEQHLTSALSSFVPDCDTDREIALHLSGHVANFVNANFLKDGSKCYSFANVYALCNDEASRDLLQKLHTFGY